MNFNCFTKSALLLFSAVIVSPYSFSQVIIIRGPYLQIGSETAINIRWRTNIATDSRVEIGTEFGDYPIIVDSVNATTDHEVRVTGLTPDTKYYYRIGTTTGYLQGTVNNFFTTVPPANTTRKIRIAAFGDCGNNSLNNRTNSLTQYRNYIASIGIDAADAWLLLGDNAYDGDTDASYTEDFFTPYATSLLPNHKLFPAPGNHDYSNLSRTSRTIPYYQVFTMPKAAECGGVASGTEAYYSFDIGNVHFLSLDSHGEEANAPNTRIYDTLGSQVTWVKQDLAANTKKWVIAYWHHPPYTKGSHNSDTETELVNIRNNFIRILERYGVDLIICGHSHVYERSKLIKGHYGLEATYSDAAYAVNASSGKYIDNTSCPYITTTGTENHGTVYVVSGSAGSLSGGALAGFPHDATPYAFDEGGIFYFEVDDNRLDAKFIRANPDATHPVIADQFTIFQNVDATITYSIASGNPITLTASWPGNYNWNTTATTRAITVTPPEGTTNYTVTDDFNCITDQFVIHVNICTAEINTWVGNVNIAWENPLNWSCGVVPGLASEVVVKLGTPHPPTVNSNVTVKKLTLQTGAIVVVNPGFTLEITGR